MRTLDLQSRGHCFNSQPFQSHITTLAGHSPGDELSRKHGNPKMSQSFAAVREMAVKCEGRNLVRLKCLFLILHLESLHYIYTVAGHPVLCCLF